MTLETGGIRLCIVVGAVNNMFALQVSRDEIAAERHVFMATDTGTGANVNNTISIRPETARSSASAVAAGILVAATAA